MYKIQNVKFINHPILGNLALDFCDLSGNAVDTVIIAGENGTGKSTILDTIYSVITNTSNKTELVITVEYNDYIYKLQYKWNSKFNCGMIYDNNNQSYVQGSREAKDKFPFNGIYSDAEINYQKAQIDSVRSTDLDQMNNNQRSSHNLAMQIKQLIVDIQASDDADTSNSYRTVKMGSRNFNEIVPGSRITRFTNAFNKMFETLSYSKVENKNNHKSIIFTKYGKEIDIDDLSSGEKQIVYRGCFLLKDKESLNGAFAFIDEPEISLHPEWQNKILDYYKSIFTDDNGKQTSQLFVVTHSPFIIHNKNRKNDKVIVLKRNENGEIVVLDKPEYYSCDSIMPIKDAYNIENFTVSTEKSIVYLEGLTDEKYFRKAVEVFGFIDIPFEFQSIGHLTNKGNEEFTGCSNMDHAIQFLTGRKPQTTQVFLYDCDTNKNVYDKDNIVVMKMPLFSQNTIMNKGIENALNIENMKLDQFYRTKKVVKDYGAVSTVTEFEKMKFCDYICSLETEEQKHILENLKPIIEEINKRISL